MPKKKMTKSQAGRMGANKTWEERLKVIEKLHAFGGHQFNYRKWKTEHLKILLNAWQKNG